jgi:small-conductance mechanosensitive channel
LAEEEDYDYEGEDHVPAEDEERSGDDEPWYSRILPHFYWPPALGFGLGLLALVFLPKSINVIVAVALIIFGWFALPLILISWEDRRKGISQEPHHKDRLVQAFIPLFGLFIVGWLMMFGFGLTQTGFLSPLGWLGFALILVSIVLICLIVVILALREIQNR